MRQVQRRDGGDRGEPSHLAVLQRVQSGVVRRADDLGVVPVGRRPQSWRHVVTRQTLGVADGVKLPRVKGLTIQRALQDPVTYRRDRQSVRQSDGQSDGWSDGSHLVEESLQL